MDDSEELLTTTQVGEILGVTPRRVKQLLSEGRLHPTKKIGNYNVFRRADIEAFGLVPRRPGRPPRSTPKEGIGDGDA